MESAFLFELLSPERILLFSLSFMGIGGIFWYLPRSRAMTGLRRNNLEIAEVWRQRGYPDHADKVVATHARIIMRYPQYGKALVVLGAGLLALWVGMVI